MTVASMPAGCGLALLANVADAFNTPVSILDGGSEGTAHGAALMAKYRDERAKGASHETWAAFLSRHATGTPTRLVAAQPVLDKTAQPVLDKTAQPVRP